MPASRSRSPRRQAEAADKEPEASLEEQYAAALAVEAEEAQQELQLELRREAQSAPVGQPQGSGAIAMPSMAGVSTMPCMGGMMQGMPMQWAGMPGMSGMPMMMAGMGAMGCMGTMSPMGALGGVMPFGAMGGMGTMPMCNMGGCAMGGCAMGGCAMGGMGGMMPMGHMGMMGGMMPASGMVPGGSASGATPSTGAVGMESLQKMMKDQESAFMKSASSTLRAAAAGQARPAPSGEGSAPSSDGISRSNPMHRAYQPPDTEIILGITDKRFEGNIRMFLDEVGYGFVKSAEFEKVWEATGKQKNDVFIHRYQKGPFNVGDRVTFRVYLNFKGKPQGTDLRAPNGVGE